LELLFLKLFIVCLFYDVCGKCVSVFF
jgi:hypothetical protein